MNAYVTAGYLPYGGGYMLYHLACILKNDFGIPTTIVCSGTEKQGPSLFSYPVEFETVSLQDLKESIADTDFLISGPSFSQHLHGLRLPGKKLMYVQDFTTFRVIDGFFDTYVSVSRPVAEYLWRTYHIASKVVPACISFEALPEARNWRERSGERILAFGKIYFEELLEIFCRRYEEAHGAIRGRISTIKPRQTSQRELFSLMADTRYLLSLSPAEGFGLVPLEAMANGCAVMGFDGVGGSDYFRSGENCLVTRYPNLRELLDNAARLLSDEAHAERIAHSGAITARNYGLNIFRRNWLPIIEEFIQVK